MTVNPDGRTDPWDMIKSWGDLTPEVRHTDRAWVSPGPPPNAPAPRRKFRLDGGLILGLVIGLAVFVLGLTGVMWSIEQSKNQPAPAPAPDPVVEVTGTCSKRIIGAYAMVASIRANNATSSTVTGLIWVSWPITGQEPFTFTKQVTLAPGTAEQFHVDEGIDGEPWFRLGQCEYGWRPL